jgi:hypothetical protein
MRALVIYESTFGNTRAIAEAINEGLSPRMAVEVIGVNAAPTTLPEGVGLIVVGGPTHAFGMSRARTREDAARRSSGPPHTGTTGLRDWIDTLTPPTDRVAAATFDTRIDRRVPGSAARATAKRLRRLGYEVVTSPESFWVDDVAGPLVDGEVERARVWGEHLASSVAATGLDQPVA